MPDANLPASACNILRILKSPLYCYWYDTGYLHANPAAGLSAGSRARAGFAPTRLIPPALLAACDAWLDAPEPDVAITLSAQRRHAIWALYRYSGVRLAELAWSAETGLPRLEAEAPGRWTLYVCGKGRKARVIPLPTPCVAVLRASCARGLPPEPPAHEPPAHEARPVIHGNKGEALQQAGLYREVKARPLPAAQALLGHASVQTTAAYAKTDLTQLRAFVDATFADNVP